MVLHVVDRITAASELRHLMTLDMTRLGGSGD